MILSDRTQRLVLKINHCCQYKKERAPKQYPGHQCSARPQLNLPFIHLFFNILTFVYFLYSGPPEITKPKTVTRTVTAGESAYVICHANGSLSPQFVWTNAAGEVVTTEKYLRLHNVNDSHGGNYTCTGSNSMGSASVTILVRITSTCKSQ